jgi:hypothetical protein
VVVVVMMMMEMVKMVEVRRVPPRIFLVFEPGTKPTCGPHTSSYVHVKMQWKIFIFLAKILIQNCYHILLGKKHGMISVRVRAIGMISMCS